MERAIEWAEGVLVVLGRGWPATRRESEDRTKDVVVTTELQRGLVAEIVVHRDGTAGISLHKGEDGVAVRSDSGFPYALSHVPLCGCGDRGCGNLGLQLDADPITPETLLATMELVRDLRWDSRPAERGQEMWQPELTSGL